MDPLKQNLLRHPQSPSPKNKTLLTSLIILLILIAAALITTTTTLLFFPQPDPAHFSFLEATPAQSIRQVCSFTPNKTLCFNTIFSSISLVHQNSEAGPIILNPEDIIYLSLHLSITQLTHLSSFIRILLSRVKKDDPKTELALTKCGAHLNSEVSRLNNSVALMDQYASTDGELFDYAKWLGFVEIHQRACLDILDQENGVVESTVIDELRWKVHDTREYTRNTVAILDNVNTIFHIFYDDHMAAAGDAVVNYEYRVVRVIQYLAIAFLFCVVMRLN